MRAMCIGLALENIDDVIAVSIETGRVRTMYIDV